MQPNIPASCRYRVHLYGPLEVYERDSGGEWALIPKERWTRRREARAIFKRLLAAPHRQAYRWRLMEDVWGKEVPENTLDAAISSIRRVVGEDLVQTLESGYGLADQSLIWTDADACVELLTEVEGLDRIVALPLLEAASLLLERGDYLQEESGTWRYALQERHETLLRHCRLWLAEGYEAQGKSLQASLQYIALEEVEWIDDETRQYCQERRRAVEALAQSSMRAATQAVSNLETVVSLGEGSLLEPEPLYVGLEVEILALAWRWRCSSGPIIMLQQLFREVIRKYDMTHDQSTFVTRISRRHALTTIALVSAKLYGLSRSAGEILSWGAAKIAACWELRRYQPEGLRHVQESLASCLPPLEKLAGQSSPLQVDAARLCAQGHLLTAIFTGYFGDHTQAEMANRKARFYGRLAQDPNQEAAALIRIAVGLDFVASNEAKALEVYQEAAALSESSGVTPLLRGRIWAGLAQTYAHCRQPYEALSCLDQAQKIWPAKVEDDPSFPFANTGKRTLTLYEGFMLKYMGRYEEATKIFSCAGGSFESIPGVAESSRSEIHSHIASIALEQRNLDMALVHLDASEEIARAIDLENSHVRKNLHGMQLLWPKEPRVKQLQEKIAYKSQ